MSRPVLVTGAAGFAGSHLLEQLDRDRVPVVAWTRGSMPPFANGVRWMRVDLLDRSTVARALADVAPRAVYHLAGSAHVAESWRDTRGTFEGNVLATHHLFEGLRGLDDKPRVLVACSAHVYAPQPRPIREDDEVRPASPYATSKLAVEMLAQRVWEEDGIPAIIARAFNHIGPRQNPSFVAASIARQIALIEAGRLAPVLAMGNLEPKRDLMDVRDTVLAYAALLDRGEPGQPYNVCSGHGIGVGELVHALIARARSNVRIEQDPARFRLNDPPLLVGDHSRLTAATGWAPHIPFDQTVDDLLEYWRTHVHAVS
jgi:GDP-4-dehydro-6-deoxy-D-mannose reductase